jgi:GH25 family lysozyme M1 (1,4-beta-N-acetylmuramidase)
MLFPDLSEYQTTADIAAIKEQTPAIILRVAYGAEHPDAVFASYRSKAHVAGFQFVGLYQYLVAGYSVASQAQAFCKLVGKLQPGEIPILDLEEGSGDMSGAAASWLAYVDAYFGLDKLLLDRRSWIYSNPSFVKSAGLTTVFASARHSWVAAYSSTEPTQPPHTLWQSTDGKSGSNITEWPGCGKIDTNYFAGTIEELAVMAWHPAPAPQEEAEMINTQVPTGGHAYIPFTAGAFKQAILFADFIDKTNPITVRLAFHSASKGFSVHVVELEGTVPAVEAFNFPADTNAVSIINQKGGQVGVTLA